MRRLSLPKRPTLPREVVSGLELAAGDRVLTFGVDADSGAYVVATRFGVSVVRDGRLTLRRPWSTVDVGSWHADSARLTVTWADGAQPVSWTFTGQRTLLPETLRERVQGSVVLSRELSFSERGNAQVAVRRDFASGELFTQVVLGRRVRADDPEVRGAVETALADLRDQAGLSPRAGDGDLPPAV